MSSLVEDLGQIQEIKNNIYSEIAQSDVSIETTTPFAEYPDKIKAIVQSSGSGGGTSVNAYSKTESDARFAAKEYEHQHDNKNVLDGLTAVNNDTLMFRNKPAGTIATKVYNKSYQGSNTELTKIIDVNTIFIEVSGSAIYSQQISVKNTSVDTVLTLQILQEDLVLLDIDLSPNEVQCYNLNHSSDLTIFTNGSYKIIYDMIAF